VDFRLSLDFFDSGLYTRTAVARLTLALAKLSCFLNAISRSVSFAVTSGIQASKRQQLFQDSYCAILSEMQRKLCSTSKTRFTPKRGFTAGLNVLYYDRHIDIHVTLTCTVDHKQVLARVGWRAVLLQHPLVTATY